MQELNNGIRADLARFSEIIYWAQIREFYTMRGAVTGLQEKKKGFNQFDRGMITQIRKFVAYYPQSQLCVQVTCDILIILETMSAGRMLERGGILPFKMARNSRHAH